MKKRLCYLLLFSILCLPLGSCATLFGGVGNDKDWTINRYQKTKPAAGLPKRPLRPVPFVADIVLTFGVGLIVDFSTKAIYKPDGPKSIGKKRGKYEQRSMVYRIFH